MRGLAAPVLLLSALTVLVAGCGGDDDSGDKTTGGAATTSETATVSEGATTLRFGQVRNFTLDRLKREPAVKEECEKLEWSERGKGGLTFPGTKSSELLTCEDVPYLAYLEYPDAGAARKGLSTAQLSYLIVGDKTIVMPLIAVDEAAAKRYLEALKAECSCGEVVTPKAG